MDSVLKNKDGTFSLKTPELDDQGRVKKLVFNTEFLGHFFV